LTGKCFPLTNFSNGKQTHESLESGFSETTFRKTNTAKMKNTFLKTKSNFSLTGKCFSLTGKCFSLTRNYFSLINFPNNKQTHESLESDFSKTIFQKTNMAYSTILWNWNNNRGSGNSVTLEYNIENHCSKAISVATIIYIVIINKHLFLFFILRYILFLLKIYIYIYIWR